MTRHDYVTITAAMLAAMPYGPRLDEGPQGIERAEYQRKAWSRTCQMLALALKRDNPKGFDESRFLSTLGIGTPGEANPPPQLEIEIDGGMVRRVLVNGTECTADVYDYDTQGRPDKELVTRPSPGCGDRAIFYNN